MQEIRAIGEPPWTRHDLESKLREFADLYDQRPIRDNSGGMKAPHMFAAWFALRRLQPEYIIESGVWLGQGTWLFEQACPGANIICIEPQLESIRYRSPRATYMREDFANADWSGLPKERTFAFFDDHQNAYQRVKELYWQGFRHAMFEDNYPAFHGDCYSLKKAFTGVGFNPGTRARKGLPSRLRKAVISLAAGQARDYGERVAPNGRDALMLQRRLAVYYEFPPVLSAAVTRWGDNWNDHATPEPLLKAVEEPWQQVYLDEAKDYTWICYVQLNDHRRDADLVSA